MRKIIFDKYVLLCVVIAKDCNDSFWKNAKTNVSNSQNFSQLWLFPEREWRIWISCRYQQLWNWSLVWKWIKTAYTRWVWKEAKLNLEMRIFDKLSPTGLNGIVARMQLHTPCFAPAALSSVEVSGNRGNDKIHLIRKVSGNRKITKSLQ